MIGIVAVSFYILIPFYSFLHWCKWPSGRVRDLPIQRAIPGLVNEYQRKLGSKRAYHAMH